MKKASFTFSSAIVQRYSNSLRLHLSISPRVVLSKAIFSFFIVRVELNTLLYFFYWALLFSSGLVIGFGMIMRMNIIMILMTVFIVLMMMERMPIKWHA